MGREIRENLDLAKISHYTVLVLSPDTDIYMIGLPLQCTQDKDIIVQTSDMNSWELKLLYMKRLIAAISNDPDLAMLQ